MKLTTKEKLIYTVKLNEKLKNARGQEKVLLHEELLGRSLE